MGASARTGAALVALIALAGLLIQFRVTFADGHGIAGTLWILVRFFTILTNLMVAIVFGAVALGSRRSAMPSMLGCAVLSIILVGVVAQTLLQGLLDLSGRALLADTLLHKVTPIVASLWWLIFARAGRLRARDPWLWALWPLAYLVYALVRGTSEGVFAYPFLNYPKIGWGSVSAYCVVISAGFVALGHGMLWIERRR